MNPFVLLTTQVGLVSMGGRVWWLRLTWQRAKPITGCGGHDNRKKHWLAYTPDLARGL